ncbi:hypothetical protein GQ607_010263 [Colletotrichum asianum]|uniref:Uncharacterized protein n=1 Tax=Colletotrichum asianum TaxID=702518 RepID=A0A8H3ZT38_9PEZI|nr:hypothetical protein GQ607_010263 [Colletotrichum asianum]
MSRQSRSLPFSPKEETCDGFLNSVSSRQPPHGTRRRHMALQTASCYVHDTSIPPPHHHHTCPPKVDKKALDS